MDKQPQLSLITPVFQAHLTLAGTAASVLAQTFQAFEWLIVVDDGNTCDYQAMPELRDPRVRWLSTGGHGLGPSVARNIGLTAARGPLAGHLDADDLMQPERLQRLSKAAEGHGVATDNHEAFDGVTGRTLGRCFPDETPAWVAPQAAMNFQLPYFPVFQRRLAPRWNESVRFSEDVLFNLALLERNGGMAVLGDALLRYRVHEGSASNHMPEGYQRARDAYQGILQRLQAGETLGLSALTARQARRMFRRKHDANEAFWDAFRCGQCSSFAEFAQRSASGHLGLTSKA